MLKRLLALSLALVTVTLTFASCGGGTSSVGVPDVGIADSGALYDATRREIPENFYLEMSDLYNSMANFGVPVLHIKLPTKAEAYGESTYDYTAYDAFMAQNGIDVIDMTSTFAANPDAYFYKYAEGINADGAMAIADAVSALLPDYYGLLTTGAANSAEGYYTKETLVGAAPNALSTSDSNYYYNGIRISAGDIGISHVDDPLPTDDYFWYNATDGDYKLRYYGRDDEGSAFGEGAYTEAIFRKAEFEAAGDGAVATDYYFYESMTTTVTNHSNTGKVQNDYKAEDSVFAAIVHDLDDTSVLMPLVDCFSKVILVDVRNCGELETAVSLIRENTSTDICISMLSYDADWPKMAKNSPVQLKAFEEGSEVAFKDSGRMMQVVYPASENIDAYIKNMTEFKSVCDDVGSELLFVQTPFKVLEGYTTLPEGVVDYSNSDADAFLAGIEAAGVKTLDLRDTVQTELDPSEIFYRTDHHWKAESGFWGYTKIIDYIKTNFGWTDVDPDGKLTDKNSYIFETREKDFVAHLAYDFPGPVVGIDDFTLIYPNFSTRYRVLLDRNGVQTVAMGGFRNTMFQQRYLEGDDPRINRYAAYLDGDQPLIIIDNTSDGISVSDKRVLVVKDSFANVVNPFIATAFAHTEIIDIRHYKLATLTKYVKDGDFDLVLFVYNPNLYSKVPNMFKFK